jgi:hypothetical protein
VTPENGTQVARVRFLTVLLITEETSKILVAVAS